MEKILGKALTFDDVLLVPAYSEVLPDQVRLNTRLTPSIELNIPFSSKIAAICSKPSLRACDA